MFKQWGATMDPVIKALMRGLDKWLEMVIDGTVINSVNRFFDVLDWVLDVEYFLQWLRDHGSATKNTWSATKEYSKIFQEGEKND
jgi:hypothetical protein